MSISFLILIAQPLNKRDFNRFGIKKLREIGNEVLIWDLTFIENQNQYLHINRDNKEKFDCYGLKVFNNKKELMSDLYNLDKDKYIILTYLTLSHKSFSFYRYLSLNFYYGIPSINVLPSSKYNLSIENYIKKFIRKLSIMDLSIKNIFLKILIKTNNKFKLIKNADFYLATGKHYKNNLIGEKSILIPSCSFDYNTYLENSKYQNNEYKNHILFLDEYLPFHEDYHIDGYRKLLDPKKYYFYLESFFKYISDKTNLEIIIAAHPRSQYERYPQFLKNYKIIKGQTCQLTRNSEFIICHGSTSISYAVIYKKPIIFTTLEMIREIYPISFYAYEEISRELGCRQIIIDKSINDIDIRRILSVNELKYEDYINNYLKHKDSKNISTWDSLDLFIKNKKI